ncbi:hypothetical protein AVEN_153696-1 [Araneus ventricosus]|uniref:Uncharacterized protein n=1 Tax=Araneus ventricosus TaxID=182803 RepID=A0A4Y2G6G0_ARAVE|nr:hypothetical protein AVEN_153696-1 [Araneus ventricosus]
MAWCHSAPFHFWPIYLDRSLTMQIHPLPIISIPVFSHFLGKTRIPSISLFLRTLTADAFTVQQSKWSDGYWDRLDIQTSIPHHAHSDRFYTLTVSFGVEWSQLRGVVRS